METIKRYINWRIVGAIGVIVIVLLCIGCYVAGRESAERDANIQRIQSTQQQLNNATEQLDEAARENQSAREITADSVVINDRIEQRIDSSETAVSRSEEANARTSAAISEAKQLVADAKRTAEQDSSIITDSKSILERAITRNQKAAIEAEEK